MYSWHHVPWYTAFWLRSRKNGGIAGQKIGLINQTNSKIFEILRIDSEVLARIQTDFHTMLRARLGKGKKPMTITCFYEELPIPGIGENHMGMTKFDSVEHPGFISVTGEIRRWIKELKESATQCLQCETRCLVADW